ncbi:hypothetical protein D9758_012522 [Tetrapyrgos nigripes]|uniref:Cytochrome P450 n=1 Tax=Tetrapyrgos nigripes TaxID=182062 RepID=A0A8H5G3C8_9AGAR|nr:hypothetical protein D9758_012522 [Tetrapyrgos nigripes]
MLLAPGLELLVEDVLPRALGLPLLVYGILKLAQYLLAAHDWPSWVWVAAIAATHPVYWIISWVYNQIHRRREAAARGAVFPPRVQESSFKIVKAFSDSALKGYTGDAVHDWSKQYGNTFLLRIFGVYRVMTTEPEHIKAILATQFDDFWKGPMKEDHFTSLLGSGVFNSDGDMWNKVRISDFDVFERHAEDTLSLLAERLGSGVPVDFQDAVARFTLDSATEFLFGKAVNSLDAGLPYPASHSKTTATITTNDFFNHASTKFVTALSEGQEVISRRGVLGRYWRFSEFWQDKAAEHRKSVEEFVLPILEDALENKKDEVVSGEVKEIGDETFLEHLVRFTKDKKVVMDELLNILLAARDTTASLITFSVYVLAQRPDIYTRLKEEITERVGNSRPTYEDTRDMKYLRAFLNEVLRLYPAAFRFQVIELFLTAPLVQNSELSPTTEHPKCPPLFRTKVVGKGTYHQPINLYTLYLLGAFSIHTYSCAYSVFLMHRREDLWGPDALEFDPDRFLDERLHKYLTPNPFIFLPFNAGPRICLGQQFAYNEASYFMIKLIQKFTDLSLALDVQPSQPPKEWIPQPGTTKGRDKIMLKTHLTMSVRDGLWVRMKPISSQVDQEKTM